MSAYTESTVQVQATDWEKVSAYLVSVMVVFLTVYVCI